MKTSATGNQNEDAAAEEEEDEQRTSDGFLFVLVFDSESGSC